MEMNRRERVERITTRIHEELRTLSLEDLEDILNSLILARSYKTAHGPQDNHERQ